MNTHDIINQAKQDRIETIQLRFADIFGTTKIITIDINQLNNVLENGVWIDGSDVEGLLRICDNDILLKPILSSYKTVYLNGSGNIASLDCKVYNADGSAIEDYSHKLLEAVYNDARDFGITYNSTAELQDILFRGQVVQPIYNQKNQ